MTLQPGAWVLCIHYARGYRQPDHVTGYVNVISPSGRFHDVPCSRSTNRKEGTKKKGKKNIPVASGARRRPVSSLHLPDRLMPGAVE